MPEYTRCVCFTIAAIYPLSLPLSHSLSQARNVSPALAVELAADSNQLSRGATTNKLPATGDAAAVLFVDLRNRYRAYARALSVLPNTDRNTRSL